MSEVGKPSYKSFCRPNQQGGFQGAPQGWGGNAYNQQFQQQQQQPAAPGGSDPSKYLQIMV